MTAPDYSGEQEPQDQRTVAQLGRLVDQLHEAQAEVERAEAQLKAAEQRVTQLREKDIPDLMLAVGTKAITTESGLHVQLREEVRASWPKEGTPRHKEVVEWLTAHGHEALIKHLVAFRFGAGEAQLHAQFIKVLKKSMPKLAARMEETRNVHHQTMLAFLREQLREGKAPPLELFAAFVQKFAEVKEGK